MSEINQSFKVLGSEMKLVSSQFDKNDKSVQALSCLLYTSGAYLESDDSFGQVSIGAYKLGTMIKVSEELLNDSVFDLELSLIHI